MTKHLKMMADYQCHPIWKADDEVGNVDPGALPLSLELKCALRDWADAYDRTLNRENPLMSGFVNSAEEEAFELEGRRLWQELQRELGSSYCVTYFGKRNQRCDE